MEINIENYLSQDEIKEIAKEEVKNRFKLAIQNNVNFERILENSVYHALISETNKIISEEELENNFKSKIRNIIEKGDFNYQLFGSTYDGDSRENKYLAYKYLMEVVRENKNEIKSTFLKQIVSAINKDDCDNDYLACDMRDWLGTILKETFKQ